ncbi:MAG TPA: acyl-CoA dehydrogenase family protein [Rubrivivax sp.]|nr:acyl-CoA dehydrogenase family protein [Rubrivivax sp.]
MLLVYAKTNEERGAKGISAFMVEKDFPGFQVAQKLTKTGFRGSPTGELVFNDCRVPAANRVSEQDRGVQLVMNGLDLERAMAAPLCLGICERALELSIEYARTRRQFGRPIADMYVWTESACVMTYQALRAANHLEVGGGGRGEIHEITAAPVMYAANTMNKVLDEAVQIHGGSGCIWESEINRLCRAIKLLEIGAGTTEVHKIIIGDELLGR